MSDLKKKLMSYLGSDCLAPFDTDLIIVNLIKEKSFIAFADSSSFNKLCHPYGLHGMEGPKDEAFTMIQSFIDKYPSTKDISNGIHGICLNFKSDSAIVFEVFKDSQAEKEMVDKTNRVKSDRLFENNISKNVEYSFNI